MTVLSHKNGLFTTLWTKEFGKVEPHLWFAIIGESRYGDT